MPTSLTAFDSTLRVPAAELRNYPTPALLRLLAVVLGALGYHAADRTRVALQGMAMAVERHRQRRSLSTLDDHLLRDLGLTREQIQAEVCKPAWKE